MMVLFENTENGEVLKILKTENKDFVNKRNVGVYVCTHTRVHVRDWE